MLGSFELRTDDGVLADVPGARLRGLLIALALEPGHPVPKATLVDWIWGERPPSDAANALQRLVSRLRKALPQGVVEGQTDGYRLRVEPDAVDAVRFERLVGQARNDEGLRRVRLLREALALWRGAAMQGIGLEWLFRLIQEPKRLWKRYLVNNPLFIIRAAKQLISHRSKSDGDLKV